MKKYKTQKELLQEIEKNLNNLESGLLNFNEIENHLNLVRELYERTITIRYKAFENYSDLEIKNNEPYLNKVDESNKLIKKTEINPKINNYENEYKTKISINDDKLELFQFDFLPDLNENNFTTNDIDNLNSQLTDINQNLQSKITNEDKIEETHISKIIKKIQNRMKNQLGIETLPTLSGSFGLNERLLYINELFDASSEAFAVSVRRLDSCTDLYEAMKYMEEIAQKYNWMYDSDTVEEFIQKVCRRYA